MSSTETPETVPLLSMPENREDLSSTNYGASNLAAGSDSTKAFVKEPSVKHPSKNEFIEPFSIELTPANQYGIVNVFLRSKDVNFQVKGINIRSKNAKEIIFTISEQNGEEQVIQTEEIHDSSVENNVVANFKDMVASELVIKLIPATCIYENEPLDIFLTALKVCTERVLQDRKPKDLSNPVNCSENREISSNSPPTSDTSEPTRSNPSREENMKTFRVEKIVATSEYSEKFKIVCTLTKPNGEKLKQETSKKRKNTVHSSFAGEIASRVEIQFLLFPSDKRKIDSANVFKISFQKDPCDIGGVVFGFLGCCFLIGVITMMFNHRLNWLKNYYLNELIIIILFLIPNVFGILGFLFLIYLRCRISSVRIYTTEFTFSKLKLILLYIFGIGFMFHSGLYAWKHHDYQENCPGNSCLNFMYDVLSIFYTFVIFVYFAVFYDRKLEEAVKNYYVLTLIHVANFCIWLNAILFGSDFLYENLTNINDTSDSGINVTESNLAVEAIEKADVFCLPAMVEFSLMAIDMLFTDNEYTIDDFSNRNLQLIKESKNSEKIYHIVLKSIQIVVSLAALVFFAFVFTVVLTTSSTNNILHFSHYFLVYFCFELGIKFVMVLLIIIDIFIHIIIYVKLIDNFGSVLQRLIRLGKHWMNNFLLALSNPSSRVLIITTIGNILYHCVYLGALNSENIDIPSVSYYISLLVNIVSLLLALLQMIIILAIRSKDLICTSSQVSERLQRLHSTFMYYTCFILGVFNLTLWASDSIGEDRRSVLSIVYHWSYKEFGSSVLYTIVFPITVFFRFQTGMDFLEFYWENVFNAS